MQAVQTKVNGARHVPLRQAAVLGRARSVKMSAVASNSKPTVLVAEKLGNAGINMLKNTANVDCSYNLTPDQLCEKVSLTDALIVRSGTKVTRKVFEASKGRLKVVGRAGVGIDNVDLAAATEHGCLVVNAPTANTIAAAEHGIALICALARNVAQANASIQKGKWDRNTYVGVSLAGKTVAIYGFGKVGSEVARRARGLGMNVVACDPYASVEKAAAQGVKLVKFEEALAAGDFHSLHMPLTTGTKGIFNDATFAKMKKGSRIVNVARGGVIDDEALVRALDAKIVAGAALDVFSAEPPKFEGNPLFGRPDVICTPHLGASTKEAQEGVAIEVVEAVVEALAGKLSSNAVNAPMVPPEILKELQPYITLAEALGKAAVGLVNDFGFNDISITYSSPRGDDLDTRLLRAMVIKGVLEEITTAQVNLVNADLLAKKRGLKFTEVNVRSEGNDVLSSMSVALGTSNSKFSGAVDKTQRIYVEGQVMNGTPFITKIGNFLVELSVQGSVLLTRQRDQPGIVGRIGTLLAKENVNISFMTVSRKDDKEAIMAIGVDSEPSEALLKEINKVNGIIESTVFKELF
nr:d-3-phosphoglycerate dehydrogenase family (SERA) [Polytomella parva]|mmetsp:Transcript_34228/g.61739  ORF Transcript_34228/g.61739 Transcript_34228/m.61739 type:complete len:579 (-) Transcript_34228:531-2267(-)|eukprot:CAMPEP_0175055252 /NCGR_PEP_ID=MMETSP0052_2-20121109/9977_1 /TAXON_ID=51329 ORGANISM="Polytomella parva, Strain SAG 63-3" /NCGR_SAMPLE_ID=MMETSP0052_2 /ASSEMBLY_ACC=CAM_ASM_000194 /LENGTH=578 /DNA_ID=CAMNT_0016320077 /DNA_START=74 /DNA_END=1810 /DNA_ORIENTATION=+